MSELRRAVDAELEAFRPDRTPPFSAVLDRRRWAAYRRAGLTVAPAVGAALLVVPVAWWAVSGGDQLVQEAGPPGAEAEAAFSAHQVLDAAPQDAATGSIPAPATDGTGAFPADYSCGSPADATRPDMSGGLVVCTREGTGPAEVLRVAPAALTSSAVESARVQGGMPDGGWQLIVDLTPAGARDFQELTAAAACAERGSAGRRLALVVDGVVRSVPGIAESVACDGGIDAGSVVLVLPDATEAQAKELARRLTPAGDGG